MVLSYMCAHLYCAEEVHHGVTLLSALRLHLHFSISHTCVQQKTTCTATYLHTHIVSQLHALLHCDTSPQFHWRYMIQKYVIKSTCAPLVADECNSHFMHHTHSCTSVCCIWNFV